MTDRLLLTIASCTLAAGTAMTGVAQDRQEELVPVQWLEPADPVPARDLPTYRPLAASDPRVAQANRMIDNEAAAFIRKVIAAAQRLINPGAPLRALPIVFQQGGNNARTGFFLADGADVRPYRDTPYVLLDLDADRLSLTLLHEGGHVVDRIVRGGSRAEAAWSGVPHSTFAVTDRVTALSEGFAIHLETLWGHYGADAGRRAYYHRLDPAWTAESAVRGEFFAPVRDVMSFSQNWARYSAVRDMLPVFEGHVYEGDYLRSQYDPARDRSRLKNASATVASEGTVASVFFWMVEGHARAAGVQAQAGLAQRGLLDAEMRLVRSLRLAERARGERATDLCDVVMAHGDSGSADRREAVERFIAVTRGTTVLPEVRERWREMYSRAIVLDLQAARKDVTELDQLRARAVQQAMDEPARLRALVGPVLPVRLERHKVRLVALGDPFAVEFDLNAAGAAELTLLSTDPAVRKRIEHLIDERPFQSYADFESRTGLTLDSLGATPVR